MQIPEGWAPLPEHYARGDQLGFDRGRVDAEASKFRDSAIANGRRYVDWGAAFRTWLAHAKTYDDRDASRGRAPRPGPIDDWARPQDSDHWPEATLTPPAVYAPCPERSRRPLTTEETARRTELLAMSPRELELELDRVRREAGCYGPAAVHRGAPR